MSQEFTTQSGQQLIIPGTYVDMQVINNQGGTAASGVMTLIGEADEGPDFSKEANLDNNGFGPDNIASVIVKYGSGRLVDAFREASAAANDPNIVGSVSLIKLVKTNPSTAAQGLINRNGFGLYSTLIARREGQPGNLVKYLSSVSVPEVAPTTGLFSYTPQYSGQGTVAFSLRENGSPLENISIAALTDGPTFASSVESLSGGTLAAGGTQVLPLTGKVGNISLAVLDSINSIVQISLPGLMLAANLPAVGDSLVLPLSGQFGAASTSPIIGAANANEGSYVIQAVVNSAGTSLITAKRINTPSGTVAAVAPTAIVAATDIITYRQVEIKNITGMDRQSSVGLSNVTFTTTSNANGIFTMTVSAPGWAATPLVGDYVMFAGTYAGVLAGFYQVTAATNLSMTCQRLSNGSSGTTGNDTIVGPITQGSQPFIILKPTIDGLGKSMEVVGDLHLIARNSQSAAAASFSTGSPLLKSAEEYVNALTISKGTSTSTSTAGGDIVMLVSCSQELATMTIDATGLSFSVNSVPQFSLSYANYPTLQDMVNFISSQNTFYAQVSSPKFQLTASSDLDRGTFNISASNAVDNLPGRLKHDAVLFDTAADGNGFVTDVLAANTQSGLPEAFTLPILMSGGTKAGTTSAQFSDAIDACESVTTNFITPCISVDASVDILSGETESTSTYSIDAVNAACKSHVILMSALKARQNRVAIVSYSSTYANQKIAASQMSSFRVGLTFQNINALSSSGVIKTYQPWMGACVAAGMQAAAGYKGIVKKYANISGISSPMKDFNPTRPSDLEDALKSGLLILEAPKSGGFRWVSDQMTYSLDNNFVYNSLQAVYVADLMALTLIQNFDNAIVGKSVAEVSAAAALSFLEAQMFDFLRLRWTAPSDDAPRGFKNASVKLTGGVMQIYLEAKLAGLIYFVPIALELSQVEQTANQ